MTRRSGRAFCVDEYSSKYILQGIRKLNSPIKTIIFDIIITGPSFIPVFAKTLHGISCFSYQHSPLEVVTLSALEYM